VEAPRKRLLIDDQRSDMMSPPSFHIVNKRGYHQFLVDANSGLAEPQPVFLRPSDSLTSTIWTLPWRRLAFQSIPWLVCTLPPFSTSLWYLQAPSHIVRLLLVFYLILCEVRQLMDSQKTRAGPVHRPARFQQTLYVPNHTRFTCFCSATLFKASQHS